eukprot:scaffold10232_cov75-Phaeocystis_antarctica.AAC.12
MAFARPAATEAPGPAPMQCRATGGHEPHWRGRELRRSELHHRERRSQLRQWAAARRNENEVRLPLCVRRGCRVDERRRPHLDGSTVQHQRSRGAVRRQSVGERRPFGLVAPVASELRLCPAPCPRRRRRLGPRPPRRRPTPTPPPTARPPPARASARRPPQTAAGSRPGRRLRPSWSKSAAGLRRRGRPGAPACPPARRAAATAPLPRRRPPTPPLARETRGRTAARRKRTPRRALRCRPRGSTAPVPPPARTAATPLRPPPPTARCSAPPPPTRHRRCAPRTRRPRAARTPPTPRPPPPVPAAAGRTRHSAPRPPQREGPRRSMPRAPSPGRPRQGRQCAHEQRGRPPAHAAGRPRENGRGPRSPRGPAADAASAGGLDRPTGRRDGGSGALTRCPPHPPRRSHPPRTSVCAIVPLYPNDDTPPERSKSSSRAAPRIGVSCTGQMAVCPASRVAAATIGLRTRSWALPAAVPRDKRSSMRAKPASPAAGSRWPMLALTPPTATSGSDLPSTP